MDAAGEPALADLEREFGVTCSRDTSGMVLARERGPGQRPVVARGEDATDLRDALVARAWQTQEASASGY